MVGDVSLTAPKTLRQHPSSLDRFWSQPQPQNTQSLPKRKTLLIIATSAPLRDRILMVKSSISPAFSSVFALLLSLILFCPEMLQLGKY